MRKSGLSTDGNGKRPLRVLVQSYAFWPSIGGLEVAAEYVAQGLVEKGVDVRLITFTGAPTDRADRKFDFPILRRPTPLEQLRAFLWADVVLSKHVALRNCLPILVIRKPLIIWHATYYRSDEKLATRLLRSEIMRHGYNVANSSALARNISRCDAVVHPMYNDRIFHNHGAWNERKGDFIYVGRLDGEKGVDLLLDALTRLEGSRLTIIGSGSQSSVLEDFAKKNLPGRVTFLGPKSQTEIAAALAQHKVMVAPSRYEEPFGIVALEGLASGCRVVVSSGGGFPEAAGDAGLVFTNGNVQELVDQMRRALLDPRPVADAQVIQMHLAAHGIDATVDKFHDLIVRAYNKNI